MDVFSSLTQPHAAVQATKISRCVSLTLDLGGQRAEDGQHAARTTHLVNRSNVS